MEIKRNDATINRPDGDRVLDAPFVVMDLDDYVKQIKDEEAWDKNDRNGITIFKTDALTSVLTCFHKDAAIKNNTVNGIFQVHLLEGRLRITTDAGESELKEGEMIIFHPGVRHNIEAVKKSNVLLQTIAVNNSSPTAV